MSSMELRKKIKSTKSEVYVYEDELDKILMGEFKITPMELEKDLLAKLSLEYKEYLHADFYKIDGIMVYGIEEMAKAKKGTYVCDWLDKKDPLHLWDIWLAEGNLEIKNAIANLIRSPGGKHEWLMVSALPMIREMCIPIKEVKELTTPTLDCSFKYQGEIGRHGGLGSTTMHICLYKSIQNAYREWFDSRKRLSGLNYIAKHLKPFVDEFYPMADREWIPVPECLALLLSKEGY